MAIGRGNPILSRSEAEPFISTHPKCRNGYLKVITNISRTFFVQEKAELTVFYRIIPIIIVK